MPNFVLGESFAIGAALCWSVGPLVAYKGVEALGSYRFSMYRFAISAAALFAIAFALGQLSFDSTRTLTYLAASGVVGVAFGEAALFQAVYLLGPRRSTLIFTLHAPLTAILGSIIFSENVTLTALLGVSLAFCGVYVAVIFRSNAEKEGGDYFKNGTFRKGLFLVGVAVICQVVGALLAKEVIDTVEPFFASFARTFSAAIAFAPVYFVMKEKRHLGELNKLGYVGLSALVSTIGGMTFLLAAFATTEIFRAVILSSLSPVFYIILMSIFRGERFHPIAWFGTILAVTGVAITVLAS